GAADPGTDALQVRAPHALRLVVRVTDVVTDGALLAADLTCARHKGGGGTTACRAWQPPRSQAAPSPCDDMPAPHASPPCHAALVSRHDDRRRAAARPGARDRTAGRGPLAPSPPRTRGGPSSAPPNASPEARPRAAPVRV